MLSGARMHSPMPAFAEAPDERSRMGRISGVLWMIAAAVGVLGLYLPGTETAGAGWVLGLSAGVFAYGLGSAVGWIPWDRASMTALAVGMVLTIPIVGLGLYLTGGGISYIQPLLVGSLLYAAFFFPPRWAWPLSIELILCAGTPLLYDPQAIDDSFLPRYLALVAGYLGATWVMVGLKRRLGAAEAVQRDIANRDPLTGIANRRRFDSLLQRELAARSHPAGRRGADDSPLALLLLDLDDFKGINDRFGHQAGDAVLRDAAERVQSILRSADTLARIGGDEFAIVAPGAQGENVRRLAASVAAAVRGQDPDRSAPAPSASVGWAVFPADGRDFETLMRVADERMLRSKRLRLLGSARQEASPGLRALSRSGAPRSA